MPVTEKENIAIGTWDNGDRKFNRVARVIKIAEALRAYGWEVWDSHPELKRECGCPSCAAKKNLEE